MWVVDEEEESEGRIGERKNIIIKEYLNRSVENYGESKCMHLCK